MTNAGLVVGFTTTLSWILSCGGNPGSTCTPAEEDFETLRVLVQTDEILNLSEQGEPLSVQLHVFELAGDESLENIDFEQVVEKGGERAFEGDFISEEEITIYPGRDDVLELTPDPAARFIVAVAIFREPFGQDWFRSYELPRNHGDSVCSARAKQQPWPDPCFYVALEGARMDGGPTPPPGWGKDSQLVQCPGRPVQTPPAHLEDGDGMKKN